MIFFFFFDIIFLFVYTFENFYVFIKKENTESASSITKNNVTNVTLFHPTEDEKEKSEK